MQDFSLQEIIESGQVFRWEILKDGTYFGVLNSRIYRLKSEEDVYRDNFLYNYFDMDTDYGKIKEELSKDPIMKKAICSCPGMRILKQDLWETMVSFIISQNNNIPRIKSLINNLSKAYGKHIEGEYYDIPTPEVLSRLKVEDLEKLKLGYRAPYIIETAKRYVELGLNLSLDPKAKMIDNAKKEELSVEEYLTTFKGIGPKVANCISLFALNNIDSFPIDVWVKRVMNKLYGIEENDTKAMRNYAKEHFGKYAGIAQQYLFYYIRKIEE